MVSYHLLLTQESGTERAWWVPYSHPCPCGASWDAEHQCFLPCPQIPEHCRPSMEEGISLFSSLLNNKHFLIIFVHALEQQKDFAVRDR